MLVPLPLLLEVGWLILHQFLTMQQLVQEGQIKQHVAVTDSVVNAEMQQQQHELNLQHQREQQNANGQPD